MERQEEAQLDRICHCLSDRTRRRVFERLGARPGATTGEVASGVPGVTRWTVMKHLRVLREAGLVQTLPEGRHRRHYRDRRALELLEIWLRSQDGGASRG